MTIREFANHVYPSMSIEIFTADCVLVEEKQAGSIGLSDDKRYSDTVVENWIIYEHFAKLFIKEAKYVSL